MAGAVFGGAVARFGHLAIRTDARLSVHAPEQAVVGSLHGGIVFRQDELALPAQSGAKVRIARVEAIVANHAAPPAAFKMARLTATCASWTLYPFWLSGLAFRNAASAAFFAESVLMGWPFRAASA